jgi:hypothetical protein
MMNDELKKKSSVLPYIYLLSAQRAVMGESSATGGFVHDFHGLEARATDNSPSI